METLTVNGNAHKVANFLNLASGQANGSEIPKNQVVVTSASLKSIAMGNEGHLESAGVGNNLLGIDQEIHTLLWGPPGQAGKTALLTSFSRSAAFSRSFLEKIRPARGPRRELWL